MQFLLHSFKFCFKFECLWLGKRSKFDNEWNHIMFLLFRSVFNLKIGLMASNCRWMVRRREKFVPKTKMYQLKLNNVLFSVRTVWRCVSNKMLYRHNLDCLISSCDVRFITKINVLLHKANQNSIPSS